MKNKIKSFGFWTALAGAVVVLINALGSVFGFQVQEELVRNIIMAIAGVLVVLGVVTMPKSDSTTKEQGDVEQKEEKDNQEQANEKDKKL